jgi:hypothetical protein
VASRLRWSTWVPGRKTGPTSDAAGYVPEAGIPVVSWIGCPYYLLDQHDTLDKAAIVPVAGTVAEMIGIRMAVT